VESRSVRNHERRTPITLIAGHAEGLLRSGPQPPALQLIQQEAQRMGTLITDLLDLARNHASGDPHRLQQCLTALVDNALLCSPAPGLVTLAASTVPAGELVLHVRDRGPGVPTRSARRSSGGSCAAAPAWPAPAAAVASASRWCVC
jgi:two-component system OmpR family sensor kinase